MIALAHIDLAILLIAWPFVALLLGIGMGKLIRGPRRFENPGDREQLGLLTEDRMERAERARRAIAREQSLKAERARMEEAA